MPAESVALALLETLVGLSDRKVPDTFHLVHIELPTNAKLHTIELNRLTPDWQAYPSPRSLKGFGDDFVREKTFLALRVPSAIVPQEFNYVINPSHAQMQDVKIKLVEPFRFDARLLK